MQCPFCAWKLCRSELLCHVSVHCTKVQFECPLCPEKRGSFRSLLSHWLTCVDSQKHAAYMALMLGSFAVVGRDVLRIIVSYCDRDSVKALAASNSVLHKLVLAAFHQFRCSCCGYYHGRSCFRLHSGRFASSLSFGAVLDASLRVPLARAKKSILDNGGYVALGVATGFVL